MAPQPHTHRPIEVAVSDFVCADGTQLHQDVRFVSLMYKQMPEGPCFVRITILVRRYDAAGALITEGEHKPYERVLGADNRTIVDADTGELLATRTLAQTDAEWLALEASFPQPTRRQGDYFELACQFAEIRIGDLIRFHIAQADGMGYFTP